MVRTGRMSIALADSIMARFPNPDDIPFRPWCYVQGYILCGFELLYGYTAEAKYWDYVLRFADQHVDDEGNIRGFTGRDLDNIMAGTIVVAAYEKTGQNKYLLAAHRIREAFADYPRNSDGGFWHSRSLPHEMWIDGVFMGQMFLTRYGAAIGDRAYCFDEAARQIQILASHCGKGDSGLFLHAYDEARRAAWADPMTGLSPEVWSEGLGWYALILVETLRVMPPDYGQRAAVMDILLSLADGLRRTQDPKTGLWYQVVDKGDRADNWHDTSGSAMFVYMLQRAIDLGYLGAERYGPAVRQGYEGILSKIKVNEAGLVDIYDACDGVCVQTSYEVYINYPKKVNAKEAVGSVLWATTIVEKPSH